MLPTLLSPHFTLDEMIQSQFAERNSMDNTPPPAALRNLLAITRELEYVRIACGGHPLIISSGYRSPALNIAINGAPNSAHCFGYAADFICPEFGSPLEVCAAILKTKDIVFDQLIFEYKRWVHLSVDPRTRRQVLTRTKNGYTEGLSA